MNSSENIADLAAALAKAQGVFVNPPRNREVKVKTKAGDTYTFAYATLDGIMDMVRGPLAANGLALVHSLGQDEQGPICETRLIHASGQWMGTWVPVIVADGANAQGWGGAITYARRYGLCSLLSIAADEDDDANGACGNVASASPRTARKAPPPKPPKEMPTDSVEDCLAAVEAAENINRVLDLHLKAKDRFDSDTLTTVEEKMGIKLTDLLTEAGLKLTDPARLKTGIAFIDACAILTDQQKAELKTLYATRQGELAA